MPVHYSAESAGPSTRRSQPYEEAGNDYAELTMDALKVELESRGLAKSGSKGDLIARLEEDDG